MTKFKNPKMQEVYDRFYKRNAPENEHERMMGFGAISNAYVKGYRYPEIKSPYHNTSLNYAAWAAGRDRAREKNNEA